MLAFSITIAVILLYILHFSTVIIAFSNEWLKYLLLAILGLFITLILASLVHELGHAVDYGTYYHPQQKKGKFQEIFTKKLMNFCGKNQKRRLFWIF